MSNRRTEIQHQSSDGEHFQVTAHETDSPILPIGHLEQLHQFRPDLVDWVLQRTEAEAEERRRRQRRIDRFIFIERVGGLFGGIWVALAGMSAAVYLAVHEAQAVAAVIGGGTLVSIVSIIITGRRRLPAREEFQLREKESKR